MTERTEPDEEPRGTATVTRLGFPRQRAAVRYGLAGLANNLGTGMFYPFAILFFHHQLRASLVTVGACYTVAIGLGVVGVTRTGALADRFGARTVLVGDALIRAAIFLAYPALHSIAVVFVLAAVASLADRTDRVAGQAIVAVLAPEEARPAWFSLNAMVQNAGMGGGAVIGGLILGTSRGYDWLAWGNAISFAFVAVLYATLRSSHAPRAPRVASAPAAAPAAKAAAAEKSGGVWSDRLFLQAAGLGGLIYLVGLAVEIGLPLYLVAVRHEPGWTVSLVIGINTGIVTLFQVPVTERIRRRPTMPMLAAGTGIYLVMFAFFVAAGQVSGALLVSGLAVATALFTLGELATSVTNVVVVNALAVPERRGAYLGVAQFYVGAAVTLAPVLYTAGLQISPNWLWTALAGLAALIIVAVWRLREPVAARTAELSQAAEAEPAAAV